MLVPKGHADSNVCFPELNDPTSPPLDAGAISGVYLRKGLDPIPNVRAVGEMDDRLEFDARTRTYSGHRTLAVNGHVVLLVPLRLGVKSIGLLAAAGGSIDVGTLDALGAVAAIAIERAQLLEERASAEVSRRGEELKTALLASLGHDLRTPLTAIRVAASNLQTLAGASSDVHEQSGLIRSQAEGLSRVFENILAMARIEAGAAWTGPEGRVALEPAGDGEGLPQSWLEQGLTLRFRSGGERFRPRGRDHHHSLKHLFQESGVVPWMRDRVPLVYRGDELVAIGDLWLGADVDSAPTTEPRWRVRWSEHPAVRAPEPR